LAPSVEEAQTRCHPKQRANLKQAHKAGLTVRKMANEQAIELFYNLHSRLRIEKHRLLPQPKAFFEEIGRRFFPNDGFVLFAETQGRIIAGMLFLIRASTLYYKFSASDLDYLTVRPNHFLLWEAVEYAVGQKFESIDLGLSEDEGLVRFKERFGAEAKPVYVAQYHDLKTSNAITQIESTLQSLTSLLTQPGIPLGAAQRGGELLYRFFV
jgi:lipid II:glycine glycyltransferase (peptidoglycan interpeptide bridge formation enzyme)